MEAMSVGTMESIRLLCDFRRDPISLMRRLHQAHGDLVELSVGRERMLFCFHPDLAEEVLKSRAGSFVKSRRIFDPLLPLTGPEGLVKVEGDAGRLLRSLTGQSLTSDAIERIYPLLVESTRTGISVLLAQKGSSNLATHITELVLRNALLLVLGQPGLECDVKILARAFYEANQICGNRIRNLVPIYGFESSRRLRKALSVIHAVMDEAIERRLSKPADSEARDLLSVLLGAGMPRKQVRDQLVTFLFAGHETTASSLVWTLALLAEHPDESTQVREECRNFVKSGLASVAELKSLEFTRNVYQESLRLFPPSWTLARQATESTRLGSHSLKRGTLVLIGIHSIHRRPDLYPDPEQFRPSRFERPLSHPFGYLPFGGGSRICIGQRVAMLEAVLFLALLSPHEVALDREFRPEVEALITAHPRHPLMGRVS